MSTSLLNNAVTGYSILEFCFRAGFPEDTIRQAVDHLNKRREQWIESTTDNVTLGFGKYRGTPIGAVYFDDPRYLLDYLAASDDFLNGEDKMMDLIECVSKLRNACKITVNESAFILMTLKERKAVHERIAFRQSINDPLLARFAHQLFPAQAVLLWLQTQCSEGEAMGALHRIVMESTIDPLHPYYPTIPWSKNPDVKHVPANEVWLKKPLELARLINSRMARDPRRKHFSSMMKTLSMIRSQNQDEWFEYMRLMKE